MGYLFAFHNCAGTYS